MPDRRACEKPPLLVFADDWGRHPSSCQHLVRRMKSGRSVLWANTIGTRRIKADGFTLRRGIEKLRNWSKGLRQVSERMWVIDLPMLPGNSSRLVRAANRRLMTSRLSHTLRQLGLPAPIVVTNLPHIHAMIDRLPRSGLVYYCTDDFSFWPGADRDALQSAERELCQSADLVLGVSQSLVRRLGEASECIYFPHGVDIEHFGSAQSIEPRSELIQLPRPRIGFFGLIYEKLDFSLLAAVAERYSSGSLVMIGPVDFVPQEFCSRQNVHLLGRRPYEELPSWISGLDVLLLPYRDDPMIRQSGPLKLRECLASGKPTVSVDVPEVRGLIPHVRVASSATEFLDNVREAVEEGNDPARSLLRRQSVERDGWNERAAMLNGLLDQLNGATGH